MCFVQAEKSNRYIWTPCMIALIGTLLSHEVGHLLPHIQSTGYCICLLAKLSPKRSYCSFLVEKPLRNAFCHNTPRLSCD